MKTDYLRIGKEEGRRMLQDLREAKDIAVRRNLLIDYYEWARIADGMSGIIVTAQLQFGQKPLGAQEGIDYFGLFHRMKEKLRELYFKVPGATTQGWDEYSTDIIIDKMIEV